MTALTAADVHRVKTVEEYRNAHRNYRRAIGPTRSERPAVFVNGWKWCIVCANPSCDNRPAVFVTAWDGERPVSGLACCFEHDCGAIYHVDFPDEAEAICAILAKRPSLRQRSWLPGETLEQLRAENRSIGVPE